MGKSAAWGDRGVRERKMPLPPVPPAPPIRPVPPSPPDASGVPAPSRTAAPNKGFSEVLVPPLPPRPPHRLPSPPRPPSPAVAVLTDRDRFAPNDDFPTGPDTGCVAAITATAAEQSAGTCASDAAIACVGSQVADRVAALAADAGEQPPPPVPPSPPLPVPVGSDPVILPMKGRVVSDSPGSFRGPGPPLPPLPPRKAPAAPAPPLPPVPVFVPFPAPPPPPEPPNKAPAPPAPPAPPMPSPMPASVTGTSHLY